jgi:hypothetical protein
MTAEIDMSPEDVDAFAYGLARLFHTPLDQLRAEAAAHRAACEGGPPMHAHQLFSGSDPGVGVEPFGADTLKDFRNTAIHAVTDAYHQRPSAAYGYARTGQHQKVLLFGSVAEASGWFGQREHLERGYDYAAVFDAADLRAPVAEDVGGQVVASGDPSVGHWLLPLALGLPAGALGGYYYRKWQEAHPGKIIPWISGDASVGAYPWMSIEDPSPFPRFAQKGPWIDVIGAEAYPGAMIHATAERVYDPEAVRRHAWPRTHALIRSAISDLKASLGEFPGAPETVFVWYLGEGGSGVAPFTAHAEALAYNRYLASRGDFAALAVFDKTSPHWPHPVAWHQSEDPAHEPAITAQIARHAHGAHVGAWPWVDVVGAVPWYTIVGADLDALRRQAKAAAEGWMNAKRSEGKRLARVLGVLLDGSPLPKFVGFASDDMAFEWFDRATGDPARFLYAAYYDTQAPFAPVQLNEALGRGKFVT